MPSTTTAVLWRFAGDNAIVSNPVVVNGIVFVASSTGAVFGVDAATGEQVWSGSAGGEVDAPDEHNAMQRSAIAEGSGLVLVPTMTALAAFG